MRVITMCILMYYVSAVGMDMDTICPRPDPLPMPFQEPLYYLVQPGQDKGTCLTFSGNSPNLVMQRYLQYLITAPSTPEKSELEAKSIKYADATKIMQRDDSTYVLACNRAGCSFNIYGDAHKTVLVQLYIHKMLNHHCNAEWYRAIRQRVGASFQEALTLAYKGHR